MDTDTPAPPRPDLRQAVALAAALSERQLATLAAAADAYGAVLEVPLPAGTYAELRRTATELAELAATLHEASHLAARAAHLTRA